MTNGLRGSIEKYIYSCCSGSTSFVKVYESCNGLLLCSHGLEIVFALLCSKMVIFNYLCSEQ